LKENPTGIGCSVAAAALAHGASVVISSSSQERVNAAVEKLRQGSQDTSNVSVRGQAFDIKEFATLKAFLSQEGQFDHLVNSSLFASKINC
jgi:NAD(P)-dependent dehydrogenase (short-subunit alcohol dehydrogenase family)